MDFIIFFPNYFSVNLMIFYIFTKKISKKLIILVNHIKITKYF